MSVNRKHQLRCVESVTAKTLPESNSRR